MDIGICFVLQEFEIFPFILMDRQLKRGYVLNFHCHFSLAGTICLSDSGVLFVWGSGVAVYEAFHGAAKAL
jgi:hypothetical protein